MRRPVFPLSAFFFLKLVRLVAMPQLSRITTSPIPSVWAMVLDMDILKMLADLREEREQIGEAIVVIERLAQGRGKRRGRPPAWMSAMKNAPKRRGRPPGSKNKPKAPAEG
jgi:hypothetical protein